MDDFDPPSATDYTPTGGWFFILCGLFWLLFSGIAHATIVETLSPFANNQFSVQSVPAPDPLSLLGLGCLFLLWRKRGET